MNVGGRFYFSSQTPPLATAMSLRDTPRGLYNQTILADNAMELSAFKSVFSVPLTHSLLLFYVHVYLNTKVLA